MNYAKATKGKSTKADFLRQIDSQSEVELGRCLDPEEKALLCSRFSPGIVATRIHKVHVFSKSQLLLTFFNFHSMAMVH